MDREDLAYVEGRWEQWKERNGGWNDAESVLNFVEAECAEEFTFREQDVIIEHLKCLEDA